MKDILLIVLALANIIQAIIRLFERRDMLNRLMSKDFKEYKTIDAPPHKTIPSAHSQVLKKWRDKNGGE